MTEPVKKTFKDTKSYHQMFRMTCLKTYSWIARLHIKMVNPR